MIDIVAVMGMHRSGTSSLAGILKHSGIYFHESNEFNRFNKRGNQEANTIVEVNDNILSSAGLTWLTAKANTNYSVSEKDIKMYLHYLENAKKTGNNACIGFKDPRFTILCDLIVQNLNEKYNFHFVGTYRHPIQVAMSITKRQKIIKIDEGFESWLNYNQKLFEIIKRNNSPLVYFSNLHNIYKIEVSLLINHLEKKIKSKLNIHQGLSFFYQDLQNQNSINDEQIPKDCSDLLKELHEYRYSWLEKII